MSGADGYKEKGNAEYKNGNYEKAIEFYTYATEMDPKNRVYYTNRSMCYAAMKKWDKSLRDAQKSIECDKNWEKGFYRKGVALQALEQYKDAVEAFETALQINPKSDDFKKAFDAAKKLMYKGMPEWEILKVDGDEAFKTGKVDLSISKFTTAIDKALKAEKSKDKDKDSSSDSSSSSDKDKEKDEKEKEKEAKRLACLADLYASRAACYQQLYEPVKVRKDCDEALKINSEHIQALLKRGQALESLEKYKVALEDFELVVKLDATNKVATQACVRVRNSARKSGQL